MPVYEYVCTVCGHPVEVMHSYTAEGPKTCDRCGSAMRKALSTPAIVFKGSGWAKKDHRDKVHASSKASAPATPSADGAAAAAATTEGASGTTTPSSDGGRATSPAPATAPAPAPSTTATTAKSSAASPG